VIAPVAQIVGLPSVHEAIVVFFAEVRSDLGIAASPRPDHAAYLTSWLKVLKDDTRAIFTAASKASEAAAFLAKLAEAAQ